MSPPGGVKAGARSRGKGASGHMADDVDERRRQRDPHDDDNAGEGRAGADDLSIPMWVWTLLGFTLVTAVVIIVIIWGAAKKPAVAPEEDPLMMDEAAQTVPA